MINAYQILPVGGVITVVTFHSLEDKIVKFFFKNYSEITNSSRYAPDKQKNDTYFKLKNKKPLTASVDELKLNPSSRSAKLRSATKIRNDCNFEEFKKKFKYLLDIENLEFGK